MATEDFQLLETQTRHLIRKGATFMANAHRESEEAELEEAIEDLKKQRAVVEAENVLNARRKLEEAIEDLKKQRAVAAAELTELVKHLAAGPLSVETAIATYESWKGKHEALEANITALQKVLSVIDEHIEELKKNEAQAFGIVRQQRLEQLGKSKEELEKL
jgi:chromosome segregation ATPase